MELGSIGSLSEGLQSLGNSVLQNRIGVDGKVPSGFGNLDNSLGLGNIGKTHGTEGIGESQQSTPLHLSTGGGDAPSFSEIFGSMVNKVDEKEKVFQTELRKVLTGESDNIHQAMLANRESQVYFQFMMETTKTLREGFQEMMRLSA